MEIPELVRDKISPRGLETIAKVKKFIEEEAMPAMSQFDEWLDSRQDRWAQHVPIIDKLKASARAKGLWNLFLPKTYNEGAGFTNVEYALMAEQMGRTAHGAEAMNCSAPDTGNMEVLARYCNEEQKREWLQPLLDGKIRSAFCMTEKGVASSDATNIQLSIKRDGDHYVLNGTKWWASGAGDPRCKLLLVMGKTSNSGDRYRQQSLVIVPRDTPGVKVVRPMHVFGYDDAPHGHMEVEFTNVRVPVKNIVWEEGRGFEIIQGRLGPGRIHHCMRSLGAAEEALGTMMARVTNRKTFGKTIAEHGTINEWIARSRIEIDYARLLVLAAAHKMDIAGPKAALLDIAKAKIECPNVCLRVVDRAIQAHGAEGVSQDQDLARAWAFNRTLRIADGPDEVHLYQLGRRTLQAHLKAKAKL